MRWRSVQGLAIGVCAVAASTAAAQTSPLLAPVFQDHAVLQRGKPLPLFGEAAPGETVTVRLAGRTASAVAGPDGRWRLELPALAPGRRPYVLMLCGCAWFAAMALLTHEAGRVYDWPTVALARSALVTLFAAVLAVRQRVRFVVLRPGMLWLRSLAGSLAEAGVVNPTVARKWAEAGGTIIGETQPVVNWSVLASPKATAEQVAKLTDAMLAMNQQPEMLSYLDRVRRQEIERGVCLVGPHRDDLDLTLGELPAKGYASHGESWSFALALRLGGYELMRVDGLEPVLVLDDVFAELDRGRRQQLAKVAAGAEQVFITAAVAEDVPEELSGARFEVHDGEVRRV